MAKEITIYEKTAYRAVVGQYEPQQSLTSAGVSIQEEVTVRIIKRLQDMRNTVEAKAALESGREWQDMADELGIIIEKLATDRDHDMGMVDEARGRVSALEFVLGRVVADLSKQFGPKVYSNIIGADDKKFCAELVGYIQEELERRPYWVNKKDWGSATTPRETLPEEPTRSTVPGAPRAGRA